MQALVSLSHHPRTLRATEYRLEKIYNAARIGLKGDSLAYAAGMTPQEYRQLCQFDSAAEQAQMKGLADGEKALSEVLHNAAEKGDAKVALEILKHQHGWVAKQQVSIDIEQRISITDALAEAERRAVDAAFTIVPDESDKPSEHNKG